MIRRPLQTPIEAGATPRRITRAVNVGAVTLGGGPSVVCSR